MACSTQIRGYRFWLWLIRAIGVIVPRRLRADWRREWEAELRRREELLADWDRLDWRAKLDLLWRSTSAFWDALWLQPKRLEDEMFQDLRFGLRTLMKNRGFTLIALLTLSLGIGANTAIFSVVNALLLRPLPYRDSDRLVWITETFTRPEIEYVPVPDFFAWSAQSQTLAQIAAYAPDNLTLTGAGESERLDANHVSAQFFTLLGAQPLLGRNFLPAEDRPGAERAVIISHGLWRRRFGGDRGIIGRSITLNDQGHVVVGVLPPDFRFIYPCDVWVPLALNPTQDPMLGSIPNAIARLKPGATREEARAELESLHGRMESGDPAYQPLFDKVRLDSLRERLAGGARRLVLILFGAVGMTLLIACANVANLQLSLAAVRQKEFAVRSALGARPWRLTRQMLTESWLLALGGGALGLLLAFWLTKALAALAADAFGDIARLSTTNLDLRALGFALFVSLLTGTLFGLAPAFQFSRPNLNDSLKEGGGGLGFSRTRLRHLLTVAEIALAIVLLAGAGLLMRSFVNVLEVNPGYRPERLLTLRVALPDQRYGQGGRRAAYYHEILQRISSLPGVESAGVINHLPLNEFQLLGWLRLPDSQQFLDLDRPATPIGVVSEDYFRTMGIPLRAGRAFNEHDHSEAPRVAILSETLARRLFPNEDAVGKQIWMPGPGKDMTTVIGVVGDVRHEGLDRGVTPQLYAPYTQSELWSATIAIRTTSDPLRLAAAVRDRAMAIDRDAPIYDVQTMERRLTTSISSRRFNLLLLGIFALLALTLAAIGVYGVIACGVTQRAREIGVRMALGATAGDVLRLFIRQGMTLVAVGIALGLAGAWALTRLLANMLFGVTASDPLTFAGVALLLSIIALSACWFPARRATKVDPLVTLRQE
jgi:putative ABC transport system permease protein